MSQILQLRQGTSTQVAAFTGAIGEVVVDTTNNRLVLQDGTTPGGWPAAKLSEILANKTRRNIADTAATILATDALVVYTSLTAARAITLCSAATFPVGQPGLFIMDDTGNCSTSNTLIITAAGSDKINGVASYTINTAYGYVGLQSNGSGLWTIDVSPPIASTGAPLASPAFTGTPTAPTPTAGDNSTKLATTAFVASSFALTTALASYLTTAAAATNYLSIASASSTYAPLASPTFTTPALGTITSGNLAAGTGYTVGNLANLAAALVTPLNTAPTGTGAIVLAASPTLTGSPIAPTQTAGDNSTKIATTAYVATAVAGATSTPTLDFRNRIINGDARLDQRNSGASGTAIGYTVDRWQYQATQASKFTWGQNLGAATPPQGFSTYLGATSSSAYSLAASDYFAFTQAIEAGNIADFNWGSVNAQAVAVSFSVYSSLTGTFSGSIKNYASTRSYPFTYTIASANTFTKITVLVPGDTSGSWPSTGNVGALYVCLDMGSGSTFRGTAGAWATGNYYGVTGAVSPVSTSGATFYVTGVQLELGTASTAFERLPINELLFQCQRYYEIAAIGDIFFYGCVVSSQYCSTNFAFKVPKIVTPTISTPSWTSIYITTLIVANITINGIVTRGTGTSGSNTAYYYNSTALTVAAEI